MHHVGKTIFIEMKGKKPYYSWKQFDEDVKIIARKIRATKKRFDGVYGLPRGGLPIAVALSHQLNIPFLLKPKSPKTLIVDDITDTGKTLKPYEGRYFIATIFYHRQSITLPSIWLREKTDRWIIFPWEKTNGQPPSAF